MREAYTAYFDAESGNTTIEGINQLESYLKGEVSAYKNETMKLKKNWMK